MSEWVSEVSMDELVIYTKCHVCNIMLLGRLRLVQGTEVFVVFLNYLNLILPYFQQGLDR